MFNATYFHYDGQWSGAYGLQIVDFDNNAVKETDVFSPTLFLQKAPGSLRFFHSGVEYDSAPTCEFSVLSEQELNGVIRSKIMAWLIGRNEFKPLSFDSDDNVGFTYWCVFTSVKTIWVNGRCHGLRLTAQFDSPFARGNPTIISVEAGTHQVVLRNNSDLVDRYTYPIVEFTGGGVDIVNLTDDTNRHFTFSGFNGVEVVTVDNEARCITSTMGGEKLTNFTSKNWLRLRPGNNTLQITAQGQVNISCPYYAMIGY